MVLTESLDSRDHVVTAREMTPGEKKNFKHKGNDEHEFQELAEYFDAGDFSEEAKAAQPVKEHAGAVGSAEPMDAFTVRLPVSVLEAVRKIAAGADLPGPGPRPSPGGHGREKRQAS